LAHSPVTWQGFSHLNCEDAAVGLVWGSLAKSGSKPGRAERALLTGAVLAAGSKTTGALGDTAASL
jgi:hypothetical protein